MNILFVAVVISVCIFLFSFTVWWSRSSNKKEFAEWCRKHNVSLRTYVWDEPVDRRQVIADSGVPVHLERTAYRELWGRQPKTDWGTSPDVTLTVWVDLYLVRRGIFAKAKSWKPAEVISVTEPVLEAV